MGPFPLFPWVPRSEAKDPENPLSISPYLPPSLPLGSDGRRTCAAAHGIATRSSAQAAREGGQAARRRQGGAAGGDEAAPRATKSGGGSG